MALLASDPSDSHPLRFVVMRLLSVNSKRGKDKRGVLQALGGAWDPELDGADPERYEGCACVCVSSVEQCDVKGERGEMKMRLPTGRQLRVDGVHAAPQWAGDHHTREKAPKRLRFSPSAVAAVLAAHHGSV